MKKTILALLGVALLLAPGCQKTQEVIPDQYVIMEYPQGENTVTLDREGTLTPMRSYDWITMTQSGSTVKFTVQMNASGKLRTAIYNSSNGSHVIASQKSAVLDVVLKSSLVSVSGSDAVVNVNISTERPEDYTGWGVFYGTSADRSKAKDLKQSGMFQVGNNPVTVPASGDDPLFVWAYVVVMDGSVIETPDPLVVMKPVMVSAGEDLQAAILAADDFSEIRVQSATFTGPILVNGGKTLSGGWNADFSAQSLTNRTVIDGGGNGRGIVIAADPDGNPVDKTTTISHLEIRNCGGNGPGGAVLISGKGVVRFCYIHDNKTTEGGAGIFVTNAPHDVTVANCIIDRNHSTGAHAGGINVQKPTTDDYSSTFTLVSTLLTRNKGLVGGYASSLHVDSKNTANIVNNTFTRNFDTGWGSGTFPGSQWSGAAVRDCKLLLANNLVVGNYSTVDMGLYDACDETKLPRAGSPFLIQTGDSDLYKAYNNFVEGCIMEDSTYDAVSLATINAHGGGNQYFPLEVFLTRFMVDAMNDNYVTAGEAKGAGSLDGSVKAILSDYELDLAGNPRVVDGKVDVGCYQAQ